MPEPLRIEIRESLTGIEAAAWDAMVGEDDPFLDHDFLAALEDTGVVGAGTPWQPRHVTAWRGGQLVGAVPFYLRWDSYGEYIFDFGWAEAYARAGLRYYPKGVVAVPFTPVTGSRILLASATAPGNGNATAASSDGDLDPGTRDVAGAMVDALQGLAVTLDLSGVHVLFPRRAEHEFLVERGFHSRITHQYHWENRDYRSFDDYLADLRSKKRKQVMHERAEVAAQGLRIEVIEGDDIRDEHVEAIWRFYLATAERKWSQPYLVRETFERLAKAWKRRLVLVLASSNGRYVAGTFNVRGRSALFGRYWGAAAHFPSLHFECCYWTLIEYAIQRGMTLVEAGAQGEHKFLRGFNARPTYSAHWIAHPGGEKAIGDFLERERDHNEAVIDSYNRSSPVKSERSRF
ncbi:MAG: GNAT family N-acetyltransferase [Candidatus Binatia bacterium]